MKLTIEEGNYLEELFNHAEKVYGSKWERILKKKALPFPSKGFNERTGGFEEFDAKKESEVIKQLQKKNIVVLTREEADVQKQGEFQEKYGDGNDQFIGIRPGKLEKLREQLSI